MVEQAFRLTIDPLFPPPQNWPNPKKGMMVDNLFENNKWELIFDEIEDGPALKSLQQNDGKVYWLFSRLECIELVLFKSVSNTLISPYYYKLTNPNS